MVGRQAISRRDRASASSCLRDASVTEFMNRDEAWWRELASLTGEALDHASRVKRAQNEQLQRLASKHSTPVQSTIERAMAAAQTDQLNQLIERLRNIADLCREPLSPDPQAPRVRTQLAAHGLVRFTADWIPDIHDALLPALSAIERHCENRSRP